MTKYTHRTTLAVTYKGLTCTDHIATTLRPQNGGHSWSIHNNTINVIVHKRTTIYCRNLSTEKLQSSVFDIKHL